mgnify:CR=1 FL=1
MAAPITRYRGDTVADEFLVTDATGAALDLTGASLIMTVSTVKAPTDGTTKLFELPGVIIGAPTAGIVHFTPSALQANQTPGKYYYDIQLTDGTGAITTLVLDVYSFKQDISK